MLASLDITHPYSKHDESVIVSVDSTLAEEWSDSGDGPSTVGICITPKRIPADGFWETSIELTIWEAMALRDILGVHIERLQKEASR